MTGFHRGLTEAQWNGLHALQCAPEDNWWKDLLNLWILPGHSAHENGLRLCVHSKSLDFYRRGQAIAHVFFGPARSGIATAQMKIHSRYVHGREACAGYLTVGTPGLPYQGLQDLELWIAGSTYKQKSEKTAVDEIVGSNRGVVDLEMAIPGSKSRVDIVSLSKGNDAPRLMLWEVKPLGSVNELRRQGNDPAKIVEQICRYTAKASENIQALEQAYMQTCKALVRLAGWAGKSDQLSPLVIQGQRAVSVDPQVGLILCCGVQWDAQGQRQLERYAGNWTQHRVKLSSLRMKEEEDPRNIVLEP